MLKVLETGLFTSIQDLGRKSYRKYGVPISGAMDAYVAKQANLLLNNTADCAVLECTQTGPTLLFTKATQIAICGAQMNAQLNEQSATLNKPISINARNILSFGKLQYGARCYIAIKGGFKEPVILNSRSYYKPITDQQTLIAEQRILYDAFDEPFKQSFAALSINQFHFDDDTIEVFMGPEFELLNKDQIKSLTNTSFKIGINNRMAYQLQETVTNTLGSILTSAVLPGTVQLTPSGKLIVLMRDAQTTGGYPRVLQLTESSVNKLAQKKLNDPIVFKLVLKHEF